MIDAGPGIPPHIALLLNEEFDFSDPRLVARKLRSMLRDLKDQAEPSSFQPLDTLGENASEFRAVLSGGLDLFSNDGACQEFACLDRPEFHRHSVAALRVALFELYR